MEIKKAYGYVIRMKEGAPQVLVFQHINLEAGIQIPKGTVNANETPLEGVIREMKEETGLTEFVVDRMVAEDFWENDDGVIHHRYFYKILVEDAPDEWDYQPTGGGTEEGLTFHFFWINDQQEVELVRGHGDYLDYIF
ncbi:NUDIX domain-containing protein [Ureibacillus sp. 179-F W5.1 NHS]|uniref:NUDIX domain-containing protein n=1 Tax=Lysinibacillus halotolerans TaxID=1368476 RepID=A0A3M8H6E9_9BACI|nr:NUDIX domain-containing protein [Lysinibacillus halotolerans]RNC97967.1 NUDIX domain-containing protein [Lysinibacillus halotolerans]